MLQVFGLLERAGKFAGAAEAHALLARGIDLAHHRRLQRAWALGGKTIGFGLFGPLVEDHLQHLRDHIACALDNDSVFLAHIEPRDFVRVMQRRVLHHHAADRHRLKLSDRRQRAGASHLNLDVVDDRRRLLGGKLVRDRPARRARDEAEPLLPVEPVDLVDDAVDVVVEPRAFGLDLLMKGEQVLDRLAHFRQRIGLEAGAANHFTMPDCVSAGISLISPQA